MRYRDGRRSLCLSSQSGCPLTCTFCATGAMRFGRNLTASEILDQALHFRRVEPVDHAVFMGMGEPMMNFDAVLARLRAAARPRHRRPRTRRSRPSAGCRGSSGWPREGPRVRLALSLHAADEALRSELMPVNDRYPLADVLDACRALARRAPQARLRRVPDARRRQRPPRAGAGSSPTSLDAARGVQGQPDPLQPDRRRVRGLGPGGDRGVPRGARRARRPGDRAAHPRPRHRRRLRPARRRTPPRANRGGYAAAPDAASPRRPASRRGPGCRGRGSGPASRRSPSSAITAAGQERVAGSPR